MSLINCEINLFFDMVWKLCFHWYYNTNSKNPKANPPVQAREKIDAPTNARIQITDKDVMYH